MKKKYIKSYDLIRILRNIDVIHRKIMAFNDIWSLFVLINWIGVASMMSIYSITVFFGHVDSSMIKSIFIFGLILVLAQIAFIIILCSSVVVEAKNTYKLLNRLNVSKKLRIFSRQRIRFDFSVKVIH